MNYNHYIPLYFKILNIFLMICYISLLVLVVQIASSRVPKALGLYSGLDYCHLFFFFLFNDQGCFIHSIGGF